MTVSPDSVHRFIKCWRNERTRVPVHAYVPMSFTLQNLPLNLTIVIGAEILDLCSSKGYPRSDKAAGVRK